MLMLLADLYYFNKRYITTSSTQIDHILLGCPGRRTGSGSCGKRKMHNTSYTTTKQSHKTQVGMQHKLSTKISHFLDKYIHTFTTSVAKYHTPSNLHDNGTFAPKYHG